MNVVCLILLICVLGVHSAPANSTTRAPLSSTNAATTTGPTTTATHSNMTTTTARSAVRPTTQRATTTAGTNAQRDNLNNARQEPQREDTGGEAVVFSGICNSEGCLLRGNVYENILPVK
ncbi:exocyst complex component 5-like isoform X1 [Cimex lectularius]|uniref:CPR type cuticle protein n=1 Tax=Cimex lectularius TaxID=79782 RepID=A0A8I6TFH3_CIMLE|nr:exocyst complex component 5-like isoform X1 [Cimex lectularius]